MSFPWISTLQHVSDHVQILAPLMLIISGMVFTLQKEHKSLNFSSLSELKPSFYCRFLGTSGQNIDKYSEAESKLDFVERTLRWRHLAPTAPNTLG